MQHWYDQERNFAQALSYKRTQNDRNEPISLYYWTAGNFQ